MTRINLVDPALLSDQHLGAEYYELPRIFSLVREAIRRGEQPDRQPADFRLGQGHCRFFYPRLGWLQRRYKAIVRECLRRGRKVNFPEPDLSGITEEWLGDWSPSPEDVALSLERINERGGTHEEDQARRFE